jgi:hypothetical protein
MIQMRVVMMKEGRDVADDDNDSVDSLGSLENNADKVKIHDCINHDNVFEVHLMEYVTVKIFV